VKHPLAVDGYLDRAVPLLDGDRGQEAIDPVLNALPSLAAADLILQIQAA
jgi:hypothetical protein